MGGGRNKIALNPLFSLHKRQDLEIYHDESKTYSYLFCFCIMFYLVCFMIDEVFTRKQNQEKIASIFCSCFVIFPDIYLFGFNPIVLNTFIPFSTKKYVSLIKNLHQKPRGSGAQFKKSRTPSGRCRVSRKCAKSGGNSAKRFRSVQHAWPQKIGAPSTEAHINSSSKYFN